jgi:acyl-CoA dehydrogenase
VTANENEEQRLLDAVAEVGRTIAAQHAEDVDRSARFPSEALAALKQAKVLSAAVPKEFGGPGLGVVPLSRMCCELGQHCSAAGMVLAMHHIQVASIGNHHGGIPEVGNYLRRLVEEQRLIASVTSEVGPSGDLRQSIAAVERAGDEFSLTKQATTVSYGAHADDLLISCRRNPEAKGSDQVLVLALEGQYKLEKPGEWDTLGMRGTCSPGAVVSCGGPAWQVLPVPFGEIAARTMVPYSHLLWGGLWLGMATEAVRRARSLARAKARKSPGQLPITAQHLSQVVAKLQLMRSEIESAAAHYAALVASGDTPQLDSVAYALEMNNLKLNASEMVADICTDALRISGIAAYKNRGEFSIARLLRDAHSAAIMINNYRLRETNATWLMVHKGD